ncbi:hypothetical protein NP233_g1356 [Leucocoprinus birnbaumii]|uniref:Uncharacterized protein n=1 Tax=Leucocoprinus birnbaumii TaxID=56174 RepID=A0AAD5YY19_9AGAR|nr:hypothetical protein NP233_g1356 [Leucocoprinus birnbaumii]
MTNTDDVWNASDKYTWTSESQLSLQEFLAKEDPSIPTRSNKKTGARSKKELREEAQAEATDKLREIATKYGYVNGKWLIFAPPDKVDVIWSHIARSLVSGPLASTAAWLAKVATSPEQESPNYSHLINVYVPDVFDRNSVLEVMKVLLRNHGATLSGVKADLYTMIGIDSKHPSGIPSTIWKNTALLKDTEIKALKEEFFANLNQDKKASPEAQAENASLAEQTGSVENDKDGRIMAKAKPKPKLKPKKKAQDDFFTSDGEDEAEEEKRRAVLKSLKVETSVKRSKPSENEDDEQDSKPKRARTTRG